MYFRRYGVAKRPLDKYLKSAVSQYPFLKQHGKGAQTHFKSSQRHVYHTCWSRRRILSLEKWRLVICKMLWLFVNTFTADDKYSLLNRDNFVSQIQMELSQKRKSFSEYFSAALKSRLNFEHFKKKVDPHSYCISEITDL